jgi:hypothetical protein
MRRVIHMQGSDGRLGFSCMVQHNKEAHGTAQHACPECGKAFHKASQLAAHASTHVVDRPLHQCPHTPCPRAYTSVWSWSWSEWLRASAVT